MAKKSTDDEGSTGSGAGEEGAADESTSGRRRDDPARDVFLRAVDRLLEELEKNRNLPVDVLEAWQAVWTSSLDLALSTQESAQKQVEADLKLLSRSREAVRAANRIAMDTQRSVVEQSVDGSLKAARTARDRLAADDERLAPYSDYYQASIVETLPAFRRDRRGA